MSENRSEPTRFQERTIDYVIRRFWDDPDPARRFLVADEVGLGKTVVAREVLAEALRRRPGQSVDIVYLCSSQPVASQNLKRLKVHGHGGTRKATRLTMLALEQPTSDGVRYFALTPDTSFKVSGRSGTVRERALIHACLSRILRGERFDAVIRQVSLSSWERETAKIAEIKLDPRVVDAFRQAVRTDADLLKDVRRVGRDILDAPDDEPLARGLKRRRDEVVGRLRRHLALHSAEAMASNGLVIVDEFQRFAPLFDMRRIETDMAVRLVDRLLSREVPDRRVLLLSATPYRIPGAETIPGQTPYADFVALVRFLADEPTAADLAEALDRYAHALRANPPDPAAILEARNDARAILRPIMSRTERTGAASNPNAMVREEARALDPVVGDIAGAVAARRIARRLKVRDPVEYWKSAPFLLDFMRDYQFRTSANDASDRDRPFVGRQARRGRLVLDRPALRRLDPLAAPSARLRDLLEDALPPGTERLLWTPPSLPYLKPKGEYARAPNDLKRLVFTEWRLAPDAIAALTSYVVEQRLDSGLRASNAKRRRRADGGSGQRHKRFGDLGNMLRLGRANQGADEPTLAMLPLLLLLPGERIAGWGDPLPHAIAAGGPVEPATVVRAAAAQVRSALKRLPSGIPGGRADERWYWAAPLLLEGVSSVDLWLAEDDPFLSFAEKPPLDLERVRAAITSVLEDPATLGPRPKDLVQVLAKAAVAAPGTCAYRALRRTASGTVTEAQLRRSAFHIARGFQSLFNQSEAAAAVQLEQPGGKRVFWEQVLDYCLAGNLQATLDEHLHFEADGLAMFDATDAVKLEMAAKAVHAALTLHRASIDVHGLGSRGAEASGDRELVRMRCRHAARFAEVKEPDGEVSRLDVVRGAFNSPFRPFVLASTAVGQEGLDFHPWCHAVVHWNLPRSPVELEQREGRVHRYKGHAVRLNVASTIGLAGLAALGGPSRIVSDPWRALFDAAALLDTENELSPCWLFEPGPDAVRIRRIVPFLRYSREEDAWPRLRARLATYRLALGLPRADDLIEALERNGVTAEQSTEWKIDLHPPPARPKKSSDRAPRSCRRYRRPMRGTGRRNHVHDNTR